jgi:hypothetical protein
MRTGPVARPGLAGWPTIRWVVYDSSTAHAAEVEPHGLISAQNVEQATALLESIDSDDLGDRRVMVHVHASRDLQQLAWRPDHEVFPELTIYPGPQP